MSASADSPQAAAAATTDSAPAPSKGKILQELIHHVCEALVDIPEEVNVQVVEGESSIILTLRVAPSDVGKVIGKGGQTAKALRKILSAAATKLRRKSLLDIIEEEKTQPQSAPAAE